MIMVIRYIRPWEKSAMEGRSYTMSLTILGCIVSLFYLVSSLTSLLRTLWREKREFCGMRREIVQKMQTTSVINEKSTLWTWCLIPLTVMLYLMMMLTEQIDGQTPLTKSHHAARNITQVLHFSFFSLSLSLSLSQKCVCKLTSVLPTVGYSQVIYSSIHMDVHPYSPSDCHSNIAPSIHPFVQTYFYSTIMLSFKFLCCSIQCHHGKRLSTEHQIVLSSKKYASR